MKKQFMAGLLSALMCTTMLACGSGAASAEAADDLQSETEAVTNLPKVDQTAWQYNADDDVYYQIGISYCETPADTAYETLAIFVPGAYMTATENGDGTYSCEIDPTAVVGSYTAETAPIVMPINTPGYSAMAALTSYSSFTSYTDEGFVYVHAGCRGRDAGAPAGVTDLKAAVRYLRYTDDVIPGNAERIFTFGMSGGGAQSALMGSTGDSTLYDAYLEEIGAVAGVSDAVLGSMCWCPITNLDTADEAYEWMMGVTRSGLTKEEQQISDQLAEAFAAYINSAGIKDPDGVVLTLSESDDGIYQAGSYYDYMKTVIEESLNHFLSDTEFPYDASSASGGGRGGFGGGMPGGFGGQSPFGGGQRPERGEGAPDFGAGQKPDGGMMPEDVSFEDIDDITRNETTSGVSLSGTYETAQDYIDALNAEREWVHYDAATNTATITSIEDFVLACKSASKNLGAFDQLDGRQGENTLFGYGDGNGAHFDATLAGILNELGSNYAADYAEDLTKQDSAGNTVDYRVRMYTPLYYLLESSEGYQESTVAKYWRIRTGIAQGDCALSTEMNLALALENDERVESVDFETIWGAGHTQAERSGNSTDNFIDWVNACLAE
ncbi:MAG: tannase [Oscillospiraceae bacterium]|nr:tannase [Oscillospiraceae bacterium]